MSQKLPGIWREALRSAAIPLEDAQQSWAAAAIPLLVETAKKRDVVTYGALGERMQEVAEIRTTMLLSNWIGRVLNVVLHYAADNGLPSLTALVVSSTNGKVSTGFDEACLRTRGHRPSSDAQRQQWAAQDRTACYRFWESAPDTVDPEHRVRPRPAQMPRLPNARREPTPRPVCSNCGTELPMTGRCDYCD